MEDKIYTFSLTLTAEKFMHVYRGEASKVITQDSNGLYIEFPAHVLRRYLTHSGVHGCFQLICDYNNRFKAITRLSA